MRMKGEVERTGGEKRTKEGRDGEGKNVQEHGYGFLLHISA